MKLQSSKKILLMSLLVVFATPFDAFAQQVTKPETLIKWRQSAFQVVAWSSSRIKNSIEGQYNKEEVIRAANTIAAIANSGLGGLFAPNTEQGKGWHETSAKPELFKDTKRAGELAANFSKEATQLGKVAITGDPNIVRDQYGKLNQTCKACHDAFKAKD